jgi:hypothetical protein
MTIHVGKIAPCEFVFGRGKRSPAFLLRQDERDRYLIERRITFLVSVIGRLLDGSELHWCATGRRTTIEALCPLRHAGRLDAVLWMLLKVRQAIPSDQ